MSVEREKERERERESERAGRDGERKNVAFIYSIKISAKTGIIDPKP